MTALLLLAVALAMDALAVSVARGAAGRHRWQLALETGLAFGLAQGSMAWLGWALGSLFMARIASIDHWIAFVLLSVLGLRMLHEAWSHVGSDGSSEDSQRKSGHWIALLIAALATSVDAAAAGLTLELFGLPVLLACLAIGAVTLVLCVPAYWFAARLGSRFGRGAEVLGGLMLMGLGFKIVFEHTGWI